MMHVIWKFELGEYGDLKTEMLVDVPVGTNILSVGVQHGVVCLWGLFDSRVEKEEKQTRIIRIVPTGHSLDIAGLRFLGTVQLVGGELVFHVFEAR